jgi:hypothetical protein
MSGKIRGQHDRGRISRAIARTPSITAPRFETRRTAFRSNSRNDCKLYWLRLRRRVSLTLDGKRALRTLLAANKRLNTAYLLKESFGQLWSSARRDQTALSRENESMCVAESARAQ